mmetsp:Transcript_1663/g.5426  ORF Transcript_1663/g.5426 Transcript_1663/m.5426 type:complete len:290 (+) Transcript_1663:831-1700(+)
MLRRAHGGPRGAVVGGLDARGVVGGGVVGLRHLGLDLHDHRPRPLLRAPRRGRPRRRASGRGGERRRRARPLHLVNDRPQLVQGAAHARRGLVAAVHEALAQGRRDPPDGRRVRRVRGGPALEAGAVLAVAGSVKPLHVLLAKACVALVVAEVARLAAAVQVLLQAPVAALARARARVEARRQGHLLHLGLVLDLAGQADDGVLAARVRHRDPVVPALGVDALHAGEALGYVIGAAHDPGDGVELAELALGDELIQGLGLDGVLPGEVLEELQARAVEAEAAPGHVGRE